MIGYLEGTRAHTLIDSVLLLTTGGVGYRLYLPAPLLARPARPEQPHSTEQYFVTTVVRDHEISLYGFANQAGRQSFEVLLKVPGIGPKVALSILSVFTPAELAQAVTTDNAILLATVPGIGKKTAARLCLDLKDRLAAPLTAAQDSPHQDLVSALTNLGFREQEILVAVRQLPGTLDDFSDRLRHALGLLSKH